MRINYTLTLRDSRRFAGSPKIKYFVYIKLAINKITQLFVE